MYIIKKKNTVNIRKLSVNTSVLNYKANMVCANSMIYLL